MGLIYSIGHFITSSIPAILAKLGSVMLLVFAAGMFAGYWFAQTGYSTIVLFIPLISILVMWQKLDEGAITFIGLIAVALLFPRFF